MSSYLVSIYHQLEHLLFLEGRERGGEGVARGNGRGVGGVGGREFLILLADVFGCPVEPFEVIVKVT